MTIDNFCFYLQNRLIQTSQTGGQWYNDTSPLSIPCSNSMTDLCSQPRPAQPSPAQPSPAQPSPAQPSPAQPSPAQPNLLGGLLIFIFGKFFSIFGAWCWDRFLGLLCPRFLGKNKIWLNHLQEAVSLSRVEGEAAIHRSGNNNFWSRRPRKILITVLKIRWVCAFDEKNIWWIAASMNCLIDELPHRWIASLMNCLIDELLPHRVELVQVLIKLCFLSLTGVSNISWSVKQCHPN